MHRPTTLFTEVSVRFPSTPAPPGGPPAPRHGASPDEIGRRVRRTFLTVNAVPLAIGVVLSCSTALTGTRVYGRLTLGVVWGAVQLGVFLVSVWWYEARSVRPDAPAERFFAPENPPTGNAGTSPARERGW